MPESCRRFLPQTSALQYTSPRGQRPSLKSTGALSHGELKMESDLSRQRARRHIVRPAEGRKEVIQRQFVGHVDSGERKTPFVTFAFEHVVVAHRNIKQVARRDARRIVVGVLRPGGRYLHQIRTILRRST